MTSSSRPYSRTGGRARSRRDPFAELAERLRSFSRNVLMRAGGGAMILLALWLAAALATFTISDPSLNTATPAPVSNLAGPAGAVAADLLLQLLGGASLLLLAPLAIWGAVALFKSAPEETPGEFWRRLIAAPLALVAGAAFLASWPVPADWPYVVGAGGLLGGAVFAGLAGLLGALGPGFARALTAGLFAMIALPAYAVLCGLTRDRLAAAWLALEDAFDAARDAAAGLQARLRGEALEEEDDEEYEEEDAERGDLETEYDEDGRAAARFSREQAQDHP